jgi:hypothetical protein
MDSSLRSIVISDVISLTQLTIGCDWVAGADGDVHLVDLVGVEILNLQLEEILFVIHSVIDEERPFQFFCAIQGILDFHLGEEFRSILLGLGRVAKGIGCPLRLNRLILVD